MRVRRRAALLAALLAACGGSGGPTPVPTPTPAVSFCTAPPAPFGSALAEWWLPACDGTNNIFNDPAQALGAPNAAGTGPDRFTGFVSLGFGGHVTVDLGGCVADQAGNDIRVHQAVSREPVTVYASESPEGPFVVLAARVPCGRLSGACEFDLASGGLARARFIKVQDGELYPCPSGSVSSGADIDAVQAIRVPIS